MRTQKDIIFKELEQLIDIGDYGPKGFIESGDGLAHRFKNLNNGLLEQPPSDPGQIATYAYVISNRTAIIPVDNIFPECFVLTKSFPQIPKLVCIANPRKCWVGQNCMGILLSRLGRLAQCHENWRLFILYWLYKNSLMGLAVREKDSNMRIITLNPHALDYFILRGEKYLIKF